MRMKTLAVKPATDPTPVLDLKQERIALLDAYESRLDKSSEADGPWRRQFDVIKSKAEDLGLDYSLFVEQVRRMRLARG